MVNMYCKEQSVSDSRYKEIMSIYHDVAEFSFDTLHVLINDTPDVLLTGDMVLIEDRYFVDKDYLDIDSESILTIVMVENVNDIRLYTCETLDGIPVCDNGVPIKFLSTDIFKLTLDV